MHRFSRMKRVTDPLADVVKAQIIGNCFSSSSSDDDDVASRSFSDLFFSDFCGDDDVESPEKICSDSDDTHDSIINEYNPKFINFRSDHDSFRDVLVSRIFQGLEMFTCLKPNKSLLLQNLTAYLRRFGYNAAVCNTRWEKSGGLSAGSHVYIDVITADLRRRYVVDVDFAAEFEIARPTEEYLKLKQFLPEIFVGEIEELKEIVRVMSDMARRSLKCRGLHLPPWRKHRFMINKWLGEYKRTTSFAPELTAESPPWFTEAEVVNGVKCRTVGFCGGGMLFAAETRTR